MKKAPVSLYGICALIALSLVYGCSKDKNENATSGKMLGRWNIFREIEVRTGATGVITCRLIGSAQLANGIIGHIGITWFNK